MEFQNNDRVADNVLVTGGAGFIGSHIVETFLREGKKVTILDNMSNCNIEWLEQYKNHENLKIIKGDVKNYEDVECAMKGVQQVWHLAGNADIPLGFRNTTIDYESAVLGTRNVLEAMKEAKVDELIFTSSGSVYGNLAQEKVTECSGPLQPLSLYAAGKVSAEAFISGYCNLFHIKSWIFRFGNVLGGRMSRGVVRDFILKLHDNPESLTILGDGQQSKSYFLIEDCIEGIRYVIAHHKFEKNNVDVFNLGNDVNTSVMKIADIIAEIMGLQNVTYKTTNQEPWPGDQPVVNLDVSKVKALGWEAKRNSDEAVREAAQRMISYLKLNE
jgi:UDP-glucose 4-epimerase